MPAISPSPTPVPTIPPPPLVEGIAGVTSLGSFNQTDCDRCRPFVAIDEDSTAVVAPWYNEILSPFYITEKKTTSLIMIKATTKMGKNYV